MQIEIKGGKKREDMDAGELRQLLIELEIRAAKRPTHGDLAIVRRDLHHALENVDTAVVDVRSYQGRIHAMQAEINELKAQVSELEGRVQDAAG